MGSPSSLRPPQAKSCRRLPPGETVNPPGAHRREYWHRQRSTAAALVGDFADRFPRGIAEFRLQTLSLEGGLSQFECDWLLVFPDYAAQAPFNQRAQGHALPRGYLARLLKQWIGDFDSGLHGIHPYGTYDMGTHIILSIRVS